MKEKRNALIKEARSILDLAKAETRDINAEERAKYDAAVAEADKLGEMIQAEERVERLEQTISEVPMKKEERKNMEFSEIRNAMLEKRAITVNGTGAYGVVSQIVKQLEMKYSLTQKYKYFYGANANTNIPLWTPGLAVPAGQNEGATSVSADATAVLSAKTLTPKAYISVLPVSAESLTLSGANLEAELPNLFADAFARALMGGSITGLGTGNEMQGMFIDAALTNNVACASAGTPKLSDLVKLALTVQDYADDAYIVIHPTLVAAMLGETTAESAGIKQEIVSSRSILGIPLVISGYAPSTTTAASVVAVAMPMSNYGVAVASEMMIDPIKVKGDSNTYFQATMFMNGGTIVAKNGWQLVTI